VSKAGCVLSVGSFERRMRELVSEPIARGAAMVLTGNRGYVSRLFGRGSRLARPPLLWTSSRLWTSSGPLQGDANVC
jgi:hypothetical protein